MGGVAARGALHAIPIEGGLLAFAIHLERAFFAECEPAGYIIFKRNVADRGLGAELKTWDGCFSVRKMRADFHSRDCAD